MEIPSTVRFSEVGADAGLSCKTEVSYILCHTANGSATVQKVSSRGVSAINISIGKRASMC